MDEKERKTRTRGNGAGTAFKQGTTWTAQITDWRPDARDETIKHRYYITKKGFKLKKDALAYIDTLRNAPVAATSPTITFNALYLLWSAEHYPKKTSDTVNGYKAAYAKCVPIHSREFNSLKAADLQRIIDNAKALPSSNKSKDGNAELGRRGKENIKSLFSNMYNYAIKNDIADKDYSKFIELEKKAKSKKDSFTSAEVDKLWDDYNNGNKFTGVILIMIYTGMRYGEISTVRKSNIHLAEHYLIGGIKSEAGIDREIPICDKVYPIIESLYNANKKKLLEMPEKMFYTQYYFALERLSIRKLEPHCCRHTAATALANAGIAPAIIIAILGHEDYTTTLKNYTHIKIAEMLEAVNKL